MDFSSFFSLLQVLSQPFKNFKNIFNKDFIKQRRHLHFIVSAIITFAFFDFGQDVKDLQLQYFPFWAVLLFGWFFAYGINFAREWYYAAKGAAKWDWLDIYAGAYGGLLAAILHLILR
jgi:hypothetical protein